MTEPSSFKRETEEVIAKMMEKKPTPTDEPQVPVSIVQTQTAKILDALPGLVGAIDRALIDQTGTKVAFVLVCFAEGQAAHATNIVPAQDGLRALKSLVDSCGM